MEFKIPFTAFLFPFVILLFSFKLVVFDESFYKAGFEKYSLYEKFDKETTDSNIENLISYMKSGTPLSDFFNEKEKEHMIDVKRIINKLTILFYILLAVTGIALICNRKRIVRNVFYGGIFTLGLILLLTLASFISFDFLFLKFHELFFNNDSWMLNPRIDNLKALLPDQFFYDALIRIFFIGFIISSAFIVFGYWIIRRKRIQNVN